ncbi:MULTISPECIES: RagB/SusD family nutrient uptake outer membrane protein [Butyricimonas]|uniref:RagB/SusD family nutrient uptake outer membrane protein n=1 Tax=Butyricimonas TaxID=574697 RepID=UPI0007FB277E|nr:MULTISPECIES: RagB/SusD family nutrient uptake outer membrane protein [Butyricimonas]
MKINTFLFTIFVMFSSCSEFLEPKSPNEYIPEKISSLNEMLLGSAYPSASSGSLFAFHNILDDDVMITDEDVAWPESKIEQKAAFMQLFSWHPDMQITMKNAGNYKKVWESFYNLILGTNAALDYINEVSGTEEEKAYVKAQALALRAFYYFQLVNLFGEPYTYNKDALGVPLKLTSALSSGYDKRKKVGEVYEQIIKDLDNAERCFAEVSAAKQFSPDYRISLPAVQLLKSRVYLYMNNLDKAAEYAKKVINGWNFELYDLCTLSDVSMSAASYPYYVTYDNPETIWAFGKTNDVVVFTFYLTGDRGISSQYNRKFINASDELVRTYKDEGDLRVKFYLVPEYGYTPVRYLAVSKCVLIGENVPSEDKFALSLRLSEAYLILAEATAETEPDVALKAMNDLRRKRISEDKYVEKTGLTGQDLLEFIKEERRRELCFEGHRWFDLRRYGMPSFTREWKEKGIATQWFTMEEEDAAYTLPLSKEVMDRNPGLEQNRLGNPK